jgi:CheY-like chemotaxis protein
MYTAMTPKERSPRLVLFCWLVVETTTLGYVLHQLLLLMLGRYRTQMNSDDWFWMGAFTLVSVLMFGLLASQQRGPAVSSRPRWQAEAGETLVHYMAHSFNNMMTAILGFCKELQDEGKLSSHHEVDIEEIIKVVHRRSSLTKQLLAMKDPPARAVPKTISAGGSETILVVDDEDIVRRVVARGLIKHGYHVLEAEDGESALEICAANSRMIDLLLTDVSMRGINGHQLAQLMFSSYPEMKILLMSGYPEYTFAPLPGPGVAFIEKTFTIDELNGKIRELLDVRKVGSDQPNPSASGTQ